MKRQTSELTKIGKHTKNISKSSYLKSYPNSREDNGYNVITTETTSRSDMVRGVPLNSNPTQKTTNTGELYRQSLNQNSRSTMTDEVIQPKIIRTNKHRVAHMNQKLFGLIERNIIHVEQIIQLKHMNFIAPLLAVKGHPATMKLKLVAQPMYCRAQKVPSAYQDQVNEELIKQ